MKCSCQLTWLQKLEAASSSSNVRESIQQLNCSLDEENTMVISLAQLQSSLKCDSIVQDSAQSATTQKNMKKPTKKPFTIRDGVTVDPTKLPPSLNDTSASLHLSAQGISIQSEESVSVTTVLSSSQRGSSTSVLPLINFLLPLLISLCNIDRT